MAEAWDGLDQFNMGELSDLADHAGEYPPKWWPTISGASREEPPQHRAPLSASA